jgi:endonuclease/exonuclease/phosphatase family metal-dependent hydrolase
MSEISPVTDNPHGMRLLTWNLTGYTGPTKELQLAEVLGEAPDVLAFQEVVRGSLDFWLVELAAHGYTALPSPRELLEVEGPMLPHKENRRMGRRKNLNLVAAKGEVCALPDLQLADPVENFPEKYLAARVTVDGATFDLHNIHTPPGSTVKMLKVAYWEAMLASVNAPTDCPRILCGDFNSPWSEAHEDHAFVVGGDRADPVEEASWKKAELGFLRHPALRDIYRHRRAEDDPFPASHIRGGKTRCRYDHVYASDDFTLDKCSCRYREDLMNRGLSDHAPVVADLVWTGSD